VRLDTHVHTTHSGASSIYPIRRLVRESYNTPEGVYRTAKARGMDLVTITDHDAITGAMLLADRPDVIVGCEVTGVFPNDRVKMHLNILGVSEDQHREVDRLRHDVRDLLGYLQAEKIFTSLNHVASGVNGPITAAHVAALLPWVDALETINGSRLPVQNRTALCLAQATGKARLAGSDAHTQRGIGRTWTEVPGSSTREEFLQGLRDGRGRVGGRHGSYLTMQSDVARFTANFYAEAATEVWSRPLGRRAYQLLFGGVYGLPLVPLAFAGGFLHFVVEERFNRNLLFDLVARPTRVPAPTAVLAA
jgi:predicted metal-dependent phosphoesterase TrpH